MLRWLKSIFLGPQPTGPPETVRAFTFRDPTLTRESVRVENESLVLESDENKTVSLYEVKDPPVQQCILTYRAKAKPEEVVGRAFLEMVCRFPKQGEHRARGLESAVTGSDEWTAMETQVYLAAGQKPEHLTLNVVLQGPGKVRVRDVEVLATPVT